MLHDLPSILVGWGVAPRLYPHTEDKCTRSRISSMTKNDRTNHSRVQTFNSFNPFQKNLSLIIHCLRPMPEISLSNWPPNPGSGRHQKLLGLCLCVSCENHMWWVRVGMYFWSHRHQRCAYEPHHPMLTVQLQLLVESYSPLEIDLSIPKYAWNGRKQLTIGVVSLTTKWGDP